MGELNNDGLVSFIHKYSDAYQESLFVLWYSKGCIPIAKLMSYISADEHGRIPTASEVKKWANVHTWRARADALNEQVAKQVEQRAVEQRVEMLNRQADLALTLQIKGKEYFDEHPIDNANVALKAIIQGAELEKSARGIPQAILKMAEMSDEKLSETVAKLLGNVASEDLEGALGYDVDAEFSVLPESTDGT